MSPRASLSPAPSVQRAVSDEEIRRCHPVMAGLRPHLDPDRFLASVRRMEPHGFHLIFIEEGGAVTAVAGYRITEMLRTGLMLEVDDLVTTDAARSRGFGAALLDWMTAEARRTGCSVLELDSATHRHEAHRFYFRERLHILAYHFSVPIGAA